MLAYLMSFRLVYLSLLDVVDSDLPIHFYANFSVLRNYGAVELNLTEILLIFFGQIIIRESK